MTDTKKDAHAEPMKLALLAFAKREMPWALEKPQDDVESLCKTTAEIAALKQEVGNALALWTVAHAERSEAMSHGARLETEIIALKAERDDLRIKIAIIQQDSNREFEDFRNCRDQLRVVLLDVARLKAERKPLTDAQIEDLRGDANRGYNIEREDYFKAFRDAESAHGITGDGQ